MATGTEVHMTYKVQIDDVVREATAEEIAVIEATKAQLQAEADAAQKAAAARASAISKLADLGLTQAEIKALVG